MSFQDRLTESLPPPEQVRDRLSNALREVALLRGLLRLAERADGYRKADRLAGRPSPAQNGGKSATEQGVSCAR